MKFNGPGEHILKSTTSSIIATLKTVQNQNRITFVQTTEQNRTAVHIVNFLCLSNQGEESWDWLVVENGLPCKDFVWPIIPNICSLLWLYVLKKLRSEVRLTELKSKQLLELICFVWILKSLNLWKANGEIDRWRIKETFLFLKTEVLSERLFSSHFILLNPPPTSIHSFQFQIPLLNFTPFKFHAEFPSSPLFAN